MTKHILPYSKFILEQDMAAMGMAPAPGAVAPAPQEKPFHFIFLDSDGSEGLYSKKYPDGSKSVDYPTYSLTSAELDKWVKDNIFSDDDTRMNDSELEVRRKSIIDIVKGDRVNIGKEDVPFIQKLKRSLSTDTFGRREPDVTIVFTASGHPTTEDIKVTFINYSK
jgi:hypothetical protein